MNGARTMMSLSAYPPACRHASTVAVHADAGNVSVGRFIATGAEWCAECGALRTSWGKWAAPGSQEARKMMEAP